MQGVTLVCGLTKLVASCYSYFRIQSYELFGNFNSLSDCVVGFAVLAMMQIRELFIYPFTRILLVDIMFFSDTRVFESRVSFITKEYYALKLLDHR